MARRDRERKCCRDQHAEAIAAHGLISRTTAETTLYMAGTLRHSHGSESARRPSAGPLAMRARKRKRSRVSPYLNYSNAKMRFQSFFMLITVQPFFFASS
jgi:hypothetical protein